MLVTDTLSASYGKKYPDIAGYFNPFRCKINDLALIFAGHCRT